MASIKTSQRSEQFKAMCANTSAYGEKNDCSVKAVALACGVSYDVAHAEMQKQGRKQGRGASTASIELACIALGKQLNPVSPRHKIAAYPGVHKNLQNVTTHHPARFPDVWKDGKTYLAYIRGHVLAIVDGVVHDWTVGRAYRVQRILEVL